jgi:hypothetical protein
LDPEFVEEVSDELDSNPVAQLRAQIDIRDESLGYLMRLLEDAAKSGESSDSLYVDHLIYSFTLRLFSLGHDRQYTYLPQGALQAHKLRRVIERMNVDLDTDISISRRLLRRAATAEITSCGCSGRLQGVRLINIFCDCASRKPNR